MESNSSKWFTWKQCAAAVVLGVSADGYLMGQEAAAYKSNLEDKRRENKETNKNWGNKFKIFQKSLKS
jgi:hypothetical protein